MLRDLLSHPRKGVSTNDLDLIGNGFPRFKIAELVARSVDSNADEDALTKEGGERDSSRVQQGNLTMDRQAQRSVRERMTWLDQAIAKRTEEAEEAEGSGAQARVQQCKQDIEQLMSEKTSLEERYSKDTYKGQPKQLSQEHRQPYFRVTDALKSALKAIQDVCPAAAASLRGDVEYKDGSHCYVGEIDWRFE